MYTTILKCSICKIIFGKEINNYIQQRHITFIKSDSKDI